MMTTTLYSNLNLSKEKLQFLIEEAKQYAFSTGLVMGSPATDCVHFAPFCLFPSLFPKEWFLCAKDVQTCLNLLLHRTSKDIEFLKGCLQKTSLTDNFIQRLFEIVDAVLVEGYKQKVSLGVFRMDYMIDIADNAVVGMKQIEMNTISTSFGAFATQIQPLHQHVLKHTNLPSADYPKSDSLDQIAAGLTAAYRVYGISSSIVVFVVESEVTNFSDQRLLEYAVCAIDSSIVVKRYTFKELHSLSYLKDHKLFVGQDEIAVVYYRTGYVPEQFEDDSAWCARLLIERSLAIQCPNVPLQLAGMKKVQQEFTRDGILEKFLPHVPDVMIKKIKTLFAGQFSLDLDKEGDEAVAMATAHPEHYVLKPQREGGGNNIFGMEIIDTLRRLKGQDREAYVLMDLISPPVEKNYIVRRGGTSDEADIVGELGIYGVILGSDDHVNVNVEAGHLLRCKVHGVNEGGVAAGYGALSQPYLV